MSEIWIRYEFAGYEHSFFVSYANHQAFHDPHDSFQPAPNGQSNAK